MFKNTYNKLIIASLWLVLSHTVFALDNGIVANIELVSNKLDSNTDVVLTLEINNTSDETLNILKWYLPKKNFTSNIFNVYRDGVAVRYEGPLIKRVAPEEGDYLQLQPGDSFHTSLELSALYDMKTSGQYTIEYLVENINLNGVKNIDKQTGDGLSTITSNSVSVWVDGKSFQELTIEPAVKSTVFGKKQNISTLACSNSQNNSINNAFNSASTLASVAYQYLDDMPSGDRANSVRYNTWFGSYSSNRWNQVTDNMEAIYNAIETKPVTFDCSCNENYYAYVYPNSPYKIYLCNAFWSAPQTGTDSKAGTIIHELSHFYVVASTNDYAYGHSAAKSLASRSPSRAVANADNHEYMAENTPNLP